MNPLLSLLMGQQTGPEMAGGVFNNEDPSMNEIILTGNPNAVAQRPAPVSVDLQQQQVPDNFILGNATPVAMAREAEKDTALNSDRRGVFGTKGTLRDILGTIGDAFLVGGGGERMYYPMRQQEKWADAMAGFSQGGEAERSAIERAMRIDPERTTEFLKQQQMNQVGMGNLNIRGQEFQQKLYEAAMARAGQMMASAVASGDPAAIENAKAAITQLSTDTSIPVQTLMSGGDPRIIAGREATANQNLRLPQQERMVGVAEGNLAARNRMVDIAAKRLGLDERKLQRLRENDDWDEILDLFELALDNQREQRLERGSGATSRPAPPSNVTRPQTGNRPIFRP